MFQVFLNLILINACVCRKPIEHQKRNQNAISQWPFVFVFSVQLITHRLKSFPSEVQKAVHYNFIKIFIVFGELVHEVNRINTNN